jgi:TonB family protein
VDGTGAIARVHETGWLLALAVSAVTHAAIVLGPGTPPVDPSSKAATIAAPIELDVEAVKEPDPTDDSPLPDRVEPIPGPMLARIVAPSHEAAPKAPVVVRAAFPVADAPVLAATEPAMPRFTISLAPPLTAAHDPAPAGSIAPAPSSDPDATFAERAVDVPAKLLRGDPAAYPVAARADGLEGDVVLELVVSRLGDVESARVSRPLGHGLDEAAVDAAHAFRFAPAMKDGRAVRVRVRWTMQFRLR